MTRPHRASSLIAIVARRIVLFAALAMLAQLAAVLIEYLGDPQNLARLLMEKESAALAEGLSLKGGRLGYELPEALEARYGREGTGYIARVRTQSGVILFSHCDESCTEHFLPLDLDPPTFWLRMRGDHLPLSFAGGRTVEAGGRPVFIEVAIERDPQDAVLGVLSDEVTEHMLVPMSLTLLYVLGATILSIRTTLAPVRRAAEAADALDPMDTQARLATTGMPREIEQLAGAVNRSYERIQELVQSQKLFTSAIAHEIRTPLAVLRLELDRIDHPRARRVAQDVEELARFVEQVVALARLEAVDTGTLAVLDLDALMEDLVGSLASWVYARGATIGLEPSGTVTQVRGHPALLKDAVRNLVENAVRHGGVGVSILVRVFPDGRVSVEDDGVGLDVMEAATAGRSYRRAGGLGIGLEIVRRIAGVHMGSFALAARLPKGTAATLSLPLAETEAPAASSAGVRPSPAAPA